MDQLKPSLGLCFFENQLFYAVNDIYDTKKLAHIGSIDFNFDVTHAILHGNEEHFPGIRKTVQQLKEQFDINHIRVLSFPSKECWTILPKLVYDNSDERDAHISIMMKGIDRKQIQPTWYSLSNQDYKFLLLRNTDALQGLQKLSPNASTIDLISEFEIGERWIRHCNPGGSFMTVCCFNNCISVASYILGKLRGATYLTFDDPEDLPYLWLQHTKELSWMKGLHEEIHVYGSRAYRIIDILKPFWDEAGKIVKMDSLNKIKVEAEEETYSFNLELAYPAIMLALESKP
jgi:hypothetical protein